MPRKFRTKGFQITVKEGYYDPDDDSFGDSASPRSHPNERKAFAASIDRHPFGGHMTQLKPFDTESEAIKAAQKWTRERG